ncbi:MAG: flavodoxin family protein [Thermodesulfobacteriota bacterium]
MKKVVCLLGSPRPHGNSATLARHFLAEAERLGAAVTAFPLNTLSYRGCQGCYACKTRLDHCILQDDLAPVLAAVAACDILVLASPTYYGEVSSQLKAFIDRTFSFLVPDYVTNPRRSRLAPGKAAVFVLCQAHPDETAFADIFPRYSFFFRWYGFTESHLIRCCGVRDAGEVAGRRVALDLAVATARRLLSAAP